jgi:hypothetical protein
MNELDVSYVSGFVKRCEKAGVDPEALVKHAKIMAAAPTPDEMQQFKGKAKAKGLADKKEDAVSKLTSSGIKGPGSPIPKAQSLRKEMLSE